MKKIILLFIIATCSSYAQDVDLANSVDYIRIQKNGESGFSRAFGLNSSNHMYIGSVEKTIGNIYFFNKGTNHLMTIKPDGNVGIGTTNPQQKLQIGNSGFTFHDGGHKVLAFNPHTTNIGQIRYDLPNKRFGLETIIDGVYKAHMLVSSNGNVIVSDKLGIGTTNPSAKLDITGISTDLPILKLRNSKWTCNQRTSIEFWNGGTKNYPTSRIVSKMDGCGTQGEALLFETQTAGETNPTVKMTLKNNGNVGIGTTNPGSKLHIQNGATNYIWTPILGTAGIFESSSANRAFLTIVGKSTAQSELWFGDENTQNSGRVRYENSTDDLEFWTNGTEKMAITSLGNVGIGTTTPISALEVNGDISLARSNKIKFLDAVGGNNRAFIRSTNGENGDYNSLIFAIGGGHESMIIKANSGNVGIGTKNPSEKLTVKGKILCGEVEVVMESTIPADYVFQKYYTGTSALKADYVMPSLEEVEAFTKANHHLPEVPSAATIKEEGLQLKEMTTLLLQKVEELTLYTIEQEKRIKSLEAKLVEKN